MTRPVRVRTHVRRRVVPRLRPFREPEVPAFHVVTGEEPLGELVARGELQKMCEGRAGLFGIDEMLGDDRYVFLSVGVPLATREWTTCFLFDAEELVREGALVRTQDILQTQEGATILLALDDALKKFEELVERETESGDISREGSKEELQWLEALDEFGVIIDIRPLALSKDQVEWFIEHDPGVARAWQQFVRKRDEITFSGGEALRRLRDCPLGKCEILVPRRLAFSKALRIGTRGEMLRTTKV